MSFCDGQDQLLLLPLNLEALSAADFARWCKSKRCSKLSARFIISLSSGFTRLLGIDGYAFWKGSMNEQRPDQC